MATKKTAIETGIKTDGVAMVQRNYIENKQKRELAEELVERNANARAYIRSCKRKHNQKRKDAIAAIALGLVFAGAMFTMISCSETEHRYTIARENGHRHYTYVTDRECKVTEVTEDLVTVECNGNLYGFYVYNTELEVGDEIICQFTDNWEIVGTK